MTKVVTKVGILSWLYFSVIYFSVNILYEPDNIATFRKHNQIN